MRKHDTLELLHRYLSGVEFRQRVEAIVDAFTAMRADLDQERRAAERAWARRAKQIDAVTFNVSGMYGDLQGLVPALPRIGCWNCRSPTPLTTMPTMPLVAGAGRRVLYPPGRYPVLDRQPQYKNRTLASAPSTPPPRIVHLTEDRSPKAGTGGSAGLFGEGSPARTVHRSRRRTAMTPAPRLVHRPKPRAGRHRRSPRRRRPDISRGRIGGHRAVDTETASPGAGHQKHHGLYGCRGIR